MRPMGSPGLKSDLSASNVGISRHVVGIAVVLSRDGISTTTVTFRPWEMLSAIC